MADTPFLGLRTAVYPVTDLQAAENPHFRLP